MKKTIIAGAASVALAAMPVIGVFAAEDPITTTGSMTDKITVKIDSSCSFTTTNDNATENTLGTTTLVNGQAGSEIAGTAMTISCNDNSGWHLNAIGAGTEGHITDLYSSANNASIATGAYSESGNSVWSFKVTGTNSVAGYNTDFVAVPGTETPVASGSSPISGTVVTPTYKAYANATQAAGTYTGAVKYTLATGASN